MLISVNPTGDPARGRGSGRHHAGVFTVEIWTGDGWEFPALRVSTDDQDAALRVFMNCRTVPGDVVTLRGSGGEIDRRVHRAGLILQA